jgi:outer membrane murein-binding lipoprotein Lpp
MPGLSCLAVARMAKRRRLRAPRRRRYDRSIPHSISAMRYLQTFTNAALFQSLRNTALTVTGALCTVGGLVADVLQPIAPFAGYLFYLSLAALLILFVLYRRGKEDLLGAVAFAAVAAGIFGLIVLLQSSEESQEAGIVATAVPAVASLQERLGIIDAKLDSISADTQSLRASAERLESNTEQVLRTLEEMRESFAGDGLVDNPSSPEEFYRNARLQELAGNYSAARQSYLAYFRFDLPLLDPHLRFVDFLKVQEGTAGARETYATLMAGRDGGVAAYVRLLLQPPAQRTAALAQYAREHAEYAPVHYHLSLEYSERRLGTQSLADMRAEREHLQAFAAADEAGGLLRHLIDQSLAQQWRDDAAARLAALEAKQALLDNPVALSWMVNNAGYTATITIAEPAQEVLWNTSGAEPASTGDSGSIDPRTGQPAPKLFFSLPRNQRDTTVQVRYRDARGELRGPFEFTFEGQQESVDANRRILESTASSWVSFRDYDGQRLLYFSHLMTYRGSIKSIRYGLNSEVPTKTFRFPAWNKSGMAPIDAKTPLYIKVPRSTRFATVQLTYKNGDTSAVQRFDR